MTQDSRSQETHVRWAGDSPNVHAVARCSALPIGCLAKDSSLKLRNRGRIDSIDDDGHDFASPTRLVHGSKSVSSPPIKNSSAPMPNIALSKSPATRMLQKLKNVIAEKRSSGSYIDEKVSIDQSIVIDTPIDKSITDFGDVDAFPNTSTPTTTTTNSARNRLIESIDIDSSRRNRFPLKRHRLVLPDSDDSPIKKQQNLNQDDDDSLIASLDLDAFVNDARQKRRGGASGQGGQGQATNVQQFKRFKTEGDLSSDVFDSKINLTTIKEKKIETIQVQDDDDDLFFANENFLAEVEKLEQLCQTQRSKK